MKFRHIPVRLVAFITLGSGLINIYSVIHPVSNRLKILEEIFPFEFIHLFKLFTLLIGFALVISAINIYKRKRRAYHFVLALSCLSIVFHLTKGLNYEEAIVSLALLILLLLSRDRFTVRSSLPDFGTGVLRFGMAAAVVFGYGIAGFWLLDQKDFGIDFHIGEAAGETLKYLAFIGDPALIPHTRHAHWFLDSLYAMTVTGIVYSLYALFRPALYQFRTLPHERTLARMIVEKHGRSSIDFFKFWPDKSFFISHSRQSVIAYRVGRNFAIVLGDPAGPEEEIEGIISGFNEFCRENDWGFGFHQTLPDFLTTYEKLGFRRLKVGDDAIVDLAGFSIDGKDRKALRHRVNKLEAAGIQYRWFGAPVADDIITNAKRVSDEWLRIPGRRERQFTLGTFEPGYVRSTPLATATDAEGRILAFANQIPSYRRGEATIDLMRRSNNSPAGVMDYLFVKLFLQLKEQGFTRFNLGMAPMSGFQTDEEASIEEKAIHFFFQRLDFLFSYRGLKLFKSKFADSWEPRYAIYKTPLDLVRMAIALQVVSEIKSAKTHSLESTGKEYTGEEYDSDGYGGEDHTLENPSKDAGRF